MSGNMVAIIAIFYHDQIACMTNPSDVVANRTKKTMRRFYVSGLHISRRRAIRLFHIILVSKILITS